MNVTRYNKNLPPFLKMKKAEFEEQKEIQDRLAQDAPAYDEDAVRFNRAVNEEILALNALRKNEKPPQDFIDHQHLRLQESYLERGMFKEAFKVAPDKRFKSFLKKIWKATDQGCDCPVRQTVETRTENGRNVRNAYDTKHRLWREVFDGTPEKKIYIWVCNNCRSVKTEYAT